MIYDDDPTGTPQIRSKRFREAFKGWTCIEMRAGPILTEEVSEWCQSNIGEDWTCAMLTDFSFERSPGLHIYGFKHDADAVLFVLRWMGV